VGIFRALGVRPSMKGKHLLKGRNFKAVALVAAAVLTLSACSSDSESGGEVGGEINVFLIPSPSSTSIQSFIPEFEAETGIKVNVSETPYGEAHQKQLLSYNQKAGAYDIAQFDNSFLAPFCQANAMLPLDSYISGSDEYDISDFGQGQQDYGKCNGETLGLTLSTEPMIQWYRTDLYEKLGLTPAKTWDEYYNNAKKLQAAGYGGQIMGFGPNVSWWWMTLVWSFGGALYDENLNPVVNSKEAVAATDYLKKLLEVSAGWNIGVPADAKNPDAAWKFLEFVLGKTNSVKYLESGAAAIGRQSIINNADLVAKNPYLPQLEIPSSSRIERYPQIAVWPEFEVAAIDAVTQVLTGKQKTQAALDALNEKLKPILAKEPKS